MLSFIYKSLFFKVFIIFTKNYLRSKKISKNGRKIYNFWATAKFFLHIFGVAQNFWFNGGDSWFKSPPSGQAWEGYAKNLLYLCLKVSYKKNLSHLYLSIMRQACCESLTVCVYGRCMDLSCHIFNLRTGKTVFVKWL